MKRQEVGFTLVEITMVMVIMGLLLGGMLKGRELIFNVKIKNLEHEYKEIAAAIYSYQDRYRALPGDDRRAVERFQSNRLPPQTIIVHGDGNGEICGEFDDASKHPDKTKESRLAWAHLRLAGLVKGALGSTELPTHVFDGVTGVSSEKQVRRGNLLRRNLLTISDMFIGFTNIPNHVAIILESRADDLKPHSGNIQTEEFNYTNAVLTHKMYFDL